ncbi:HNH endonuclease [Streptomyces sp. MUM 203J]|uniref:HNH endonuclease family protein n=1 Tax=Streptomyces sp. MUM 203J TaxID=2791990 RepID=UPI001F0396CC|nr:HNH endonuclease family protein [Streptomyces sp. MUM 203J]MCH0538093.1 HNH endonuclease [Streptomyces sp. MUM 203J]
MRHQRRWRVRAFAAATALTALTVAGCTATGEGTDRKGAATPSAPASPSTGGGTGGSDDSALPGMPTAAEARARLDGLTVAPHGSMRGYSRSKFPHWAEQGQKCNTRETVLEREGAEVRQDEQCRAVSGTWVSVYDDVTVDDASELDIDHMVPLANAWRSGADKWDQEKRRAFANDLTHPQLLAVTARTNRSKGDQGPDQWQPPSKTYWCAYGRAWTSVKATYELTVTEAEKDKLVEMLNTCDS